MPASTLDMRKAAPIRQESGRPHVLNTVEDERNVPIMTYATPSTPLPAHDLNHIQETAAGWYAKADGLRLAADNLLISAGLTPPTAAPPAPVTLPVGVTCLSTRRRNRHGGAA